MPRPSEVHIDAAMTDISVAYQNGMFIADQVAPVVGVKKQSDKYYIIDAKREGIRNQPTLRAPGTEAFTADFHYTNATYYCDDHALDGVIADEDRANADKAIDLEIDVTENTASKILLGKEIELASDLDTDITATAAAAKYWTDDSSDPITEVKTGIASIRDATGYVPNMAWCDFDVAQALRDHASIIDRVKYSSSPGAPAILTLDAIATVFGLEKLLVASGQKNGAVLDATASVTPIWGTTFYLGYTPSRPGLRTMALAYTFAWNFRGGKGGKVVKRRRDEGRESDILRVGYSYDQKTITAGAGYRISATIA